MKSHVLFLPLLASLSAPAFAGSSRLPLPPPSLPMKPSVTTSPQISTTTTFPKSPTTTISEQRREQLQRMGGGVVDGGGGDEVGIAFQAEAARAILRLRAHVSLNDFRKLKNTVDTVSYIVIDQNLSVLSGFGQLQNSVAVNVPEENTIYIQRGRWNAIKESNERQALVAHELLSLIGLEKTGDYRISSKLHGPDIDGLAAAKQVLLFDKYYNQDPIGFSSDSVGNVCSNKKEEFEKKYYFVYCSYLEKTITNPSRRRSHLEVSTVYGLRVYGIGERSTLQWQTVFSSLAYGPGQVLSTTYTTEDDARRACYLTIFNSRDEEMWTEPRCEILPTEEGEYYYLIQTQNPLLNK